MRGGPHTHIQRNMTSHSKYTVATCLRQCASVCLIPAEDMPRHRSTRNMSMYCSLVQKHVSVLQSGTAGQCTAVWSIQMERPHQPVATPSYAASAPCIPMCSILLCCLFRQMTCYKISSHNIIRMQSHPYQI